MSFISIGDDIKIIILALKFLNICIFTVNIIFHKREQREKNNEKFRAVKFIEKAHLNNFFKLQMKLRKNEIQLNL